MSAIGVIVRNSDVSLFADTAATSATGKLRENTSKLKAYPARRMATAVSGFVKHIPAIADVVDRFANFDDAQAGLADALRAEPNLWIKFVLWDVMVAGMSKDGPAAFMLTNFPRKGIINAYEPMDIEFVYYAPPITLENEGRQALVDPVGFARHALAKQRRTKSGRRLFRSFCAVGGNAEIVTVDARSVRKRTIGRWPDKVGEALDAEAALVAVRPGMPSPADAISLLARELEMVA